MLLFVCNKSWVLVQVSFKLECSCVLQIRTEHIVLSVEDHSTLDESHT